MTGEGEEILPISETGGKGDPLSPDIPVVPGSQDGKTIVEQIDYFNRIDAMIPKISETAKKPWEELTERLDLPEISPGIKGQIRGYFQAVEVMHEHRNEANGHEVVRSEEDRAREMAMTYFMVKYFIYSRNQRVDDLYSPEIKEAKEIKLRLFPYGVPKLIICLDGRVLSKLIAGLKGNAYRTPAGDTHEFLPKENDEGLFLQEGDLTSLLDQALQEQNDLVEVLDSHLACAAQGLKCDERENGKHVPDRGLRRDVIRKKQEAKALKEFAFAKYHHGPKKTILPIQISFNPHNAYLYMGLEKDECLMDERVRGTNEEGVQNGFTNENLQLLTAEGKIISTRDLVENDPEGFLKKLFVTHFFEVDYEDDYRNSTATFWKNVEKMSKEVIPFLEGKLLSVFPELKMLLRKKELRTRALFLLANAYNAFLLNNSERGTYPYDRHDESLIAVTATEKGPYAAARAFSINPKDPNLAGSIHLSAGIIRDNRKHGRMSPLKRKAYDTLNEERKDIVNNTIPVMVFSNMGEKPSEEWIQKLQSADWSDIVSFPWMSMTRSEFDKYLNRKLPEIPMYIAAAINDLRKQAIELYTPGKAVMNDLLDGRLTPFFHLCDPDRKTIALLPFLARGYQPPKY